MLNLVDPPFPRPIYLIKRRVDPFTSPAAESLFDAAMLKLPQLERPYPLFK